MREVDLMGYLPPFMQEYREIRETLEAENPEFVLLWDAAEQTLQNAFIATADEYGVSRFESMLGITPGSSDTLESRRSRVQAQWFKTLPYTLRMFVSRLSALCGTDFTVAHNFGEGYTLHLDTDLELFGQMDELEGLINEMLPCNIVVEGNNNIHCECTCGICIGTAVTAAEFYEIT